MQRYVVESAECRDNAVDYVPPVPSADPLWDLDARVDALGAATGVVMLEPNLHVSLLWIPRELFCRYAAAAGSALRDVSSLGKLQPTCLKNALCFPSDSLDFL